MKWLWPSIDCRDDALNVARTTSYLAFFGAVVTAIVASLALAKIFPVPGIGSPLGFIDAALLLIIGIGIRRMSRIAAAGGLIYYVVNQFLMISSSGQFRVSFVVILFTIWYINGVRACFAFHGFGPSASESDEAPVKPEFDMFGRPVPGSVALPQVMRPGQASPDTSPAPEKEVSRSNPVPFILTLLISVSGLVLLGCYLGGWRFQPDALMSRFHPSETRFVKLHLTSGSEFEGVIEKETSGQLTISFEGGSMVLARKDILSVEALDAKALAQSMPLFKYFPRENLFKKWASQTPSQTQSVTAPVKSAAPRSGASLMPEMPITPDARAYQRAMDAALKAKAEAKRNNDMINRAVKEAETR